MDISVIENAANTIWGNPNASNEDRKQAEYVFQELKKVLSLEHIQQIISVTQNQYVLFQVAQYTGELVLKQWSLLSQEQVEGLYQLLIEYVIRTENLSSFATSAFLRSVAMILKRGSIDKKAGPESRVFDLIRNLLTSEDARLQSIGCQMISSITEQFSSHWRNAEFSITWDFHITAKAEFERTGLRCLLEMSLETLHHLCNSVDILRNEFARRLCDKFLEVAENIFSWNFSSKLFRKLFALNQTASTFRPPASWSDLVRNDELFSLFFKLHSLIRHDEGLSARSMSCLVQLSGLSGECLNDDPSIPTQFAFGQRFVNNFISNLLDLFADGPLPHEVHCFCMIIQRMVLYRPVQTLVRLSHDGDNGGLRHRFFSYLNKYIFYLTERAVHKSIAECEHGEKESLSLLYDAWVMMLRGRWRTGFSDKEQDEIEQTFFMAPTWDIVQKFIQSVQSSPIGNRPVAKDEDNDDDDSDDRALFEELLTPLGFMISYSVERFLDNIVVILRGRTVDLQNMITGQTPASNLLVWQEDMHWLMLVIGTSLVSEDLDGTCSLANDVYEYLEHLTKERGSLYDEETKQQFLCMCLENPTADRPTKSPDIDPFIMMIGEIFAWCSVLFKVLSTDSVAESLSPEVVRSSLMCARRYMNVISRIPENLGDSDPLCTPYIPAYGPLNDLIVRFCLDMSFLVLKKFRGEEKCCKDAVDFLCCLIESRANALAAEPQLFKHMGEIDIASLPSRTVLMKALVQIAAGAKDESLQKNMYDHILLPLGERMTYLSQQPSTTESDSLLTDIIQCFTGVAQGGEHTSGPVLAKLLHPLLQQCVPLMTTRSHCATLVTAILQLLYDTTTRVSIYVDDKDEETVLYETIVSISRAYCEGQLQRYAGITLDDEEKAQDLMLFLDVLMNVMSKDLLVDGEAFGGKVSVIAMETLMGVMNEGMLQLPDLAKKFFRFICYLVQFAPEAMKSMSAQFLISVAELLRTGLSSSYGVEVSSLSLEGIYAVATYLGQDSTAGTLEFRQSMLQMLPTVFETCLEYSCDNALFADASNALFSLISIERGYYDAFVHELLSRKQNEAAAIQLRESFNKLLPPNVDLTGRREKVEFKKRMEKFLNNIQGLLVTN